MAKLKDDASSLFRRQMAWNPGWKFISVFRYSRRGCGRKYNPEREQVQNWVTGLKQMGRGVAFLPPENHPGCSRGDSKSAEYRKTAKVYKEAGTLVNPWRRIFLPALNHPVLLLFLPWIFFCFANPCLSLKSSFSFRGSLLQLSDNPCSQVSGRAGASRVSRFL